MSAAFRLPSTSPNSPCNQNTGDTDRRDAVRLRRALPYNQVLAGFLDGDGNAQGRPVGVAINRQGALRVTDDVGNRVWRVTAAKPERTARR